MSNAVETLSALERRIQLSVAVADVEREVESRLRKIGSTAKMPGFRPGKVPLKMVAQTYGPDIRLEVLNKKISEAFSQAVNAADFRVASLLRVEPVAGEPDAANTTSMNFSAVFEVYPEVVLGSLADIEVEKAECPLGDEQIVKTLDILRKQRCTYEEQAGRAVESGDRITLDFTGRLNGEAFDGGSAEDFQFTVGEQRMLPEFETAVLGMKAGDSKKFDLKFPDAYPAANLAGQTAEFEVAIKKVEQEVLPEVDAEFAKAFGVADGNIEKFQADLRANLEREVGKRIQARTKENVMEALLKSTQLDVPKTLVQQEAQRLLETGVENMKQRGGQVPEGLTTEIFTEQAERRVRLGLILAELVKRNELQSKQPQVRAKIEELAQGYDNPQEVMRWYLSDKKRLEEVEAIIVEDNVVQWVLANAKTNAKVLPFEEVMGVVQ